METAVSAASWLVGKVVEKLYDELVKAYVSSSVLGLNSEQIKTDLMFTQGLLHEAQGRSLSDNPGLHGLLQQLSKKADEAEDVLDELHYYIIQDQHDGTREAALEVGNGLRDHALHGRHAVRHTVGNWFPCFSCSSMQDAAAAATNDPQNTTTKPDNDNGGHADKLPFDRVAMSNKIKTVIEGLHALCDPVSNLLKINHTTGKAASLKRPPTSSIITQDKLYGRDTIFDQTVNDITSGTYHGETLSVLPIVGPGGIGKTTFTQHLYNDKRTEALFSVRVWVCVSTNFDVIKLTRQILKCIPATENEESNMANDTTNLNQLQTSITQRLKSKRFLIVLDDIWKCNSEDEWKNLLSPFTKGEAKGNMVLVTTRFPKIAEMVMKGTKPINLQGLEPEEFFTFFQACIFGENKLGHYNDDLIEIARQIANKLKCSPLAAKTVGRLLKNNLSREHWVEVLETNEWHNQTNDDDIMPALKISYDYLPFHLKKCFSYCALFPEDHRFDKLEITRFWIAVGIIVSCDENSKIEDTGLKYLDELVDNGFLVEVDDSAQNMTYVMHGLLHDLAQNVSSQECVNISSSRVRADDIPPSIQHLSITIEDKHDNNFEEEMGKLKRRIDIRNLRTLMFFGYSANIANILKDTFKEIKGLRVLFIVMNSSKSLPHNFSELIHLQYLKIESPNGVQMTLPSKLSRFYHLKFLDLKYWCGSHSLPKDISPLVNLRHFLAKQELHSNVCEVGKIKCLQELKEFCVKKESVGFDRALGRAQ